MVLVLLLALLLVVLLVLTQELEKDLLSFKGEKIVVDTLKQHKKKILDANDEFTKK